MKYLILLFIPLLTLSATKTHAENPNVVVIPFFENSSSNTKNSQNTLILDNSNLTSVNYINPGSYITVQGEINITSNLSLGDSPSLRVNGGVIKSSNSSIITFGPKSIITGVFFKDISIEGNELIFINCDFTNSLLPEDSIINNGSIIDSNNSTPVGALINTSVSNSQIAANLISNSEIESSVVNDIFSIQDTLINNSVINIASNGESILANNVLIESSLLLSSNSGGTKISGNKFTGFHSTQLNTINMSVLNSNDARILSISNNDFILQPNQATSIKISGNPANENIVNTIQGNTFLNGKQAIEHTGDSQTIIKNNTIISTTLGVTNNNSISLFNNFIN